MNRMNLLKKYAFAAFIGGSLFSASCKHEPTGIHPTIDPSKTQYPLEVANIIINKCATAGCHNEASHTAAGGLRLDDWEYMFDGGSNGAVTVAYSPENSSILYFLNPSKGEYDRISVEPTMPYNESPLSKSEYDVIKKWIEDGAPDKNGNIPFGSNAATRQKMYMTQQGCDLVAVVDAEKKVVMRYIKVGANPASPEAPHFVKVDSKGEYAYVCFTAGKVIQKIDTRTDKVVGEVSLANGESDGYNYNIVQVSEDGTKLIASQLVANGSISIIDAVNMKWINNPVKLTEPHGIAATKNFDTFFITGQKGNCVFKVVGTAITMLSLDGNPPDTKTGNATPDPHEIMMAPDYSKYFLTCEKTNDVRVMDRFGDTLLKVIPTGIKPQEMAISKIRPYLFVSCMEDVSQVSTLFRGSILVINYNTLEVVKRIDGTFYQPHAIGVDDKNGFVYFVSRNSNPNGPAPHHTSDCGGRNGYYQVYDLNTLEPINKRRYEVTPDPYSIDARFK